MDNVHVLMGLDFVPRAVLSYLFLSGARSDWHFNMLPLSAERGAGRRGAGEGSWLGGVQEALMGSLAAASGPQQAVWGGVLWEGQPALPRTRDECWAIFQDGGKWEAGKDLGERRETLACLPSWLHLWGGGGGVGVSIPGQGALPVLCLREMLGM